MTTCESCGRVESDTVTASTWTVSFERGRRHGVCVDCSRENLRAVEAKLDPAWW